MCPVCAGAVRKLLSSPAIQFKGAGWYITDYARKGSGGGDSSKSDSAKTDSTKTDSAKSDSAKSESKGGSDSTTKSS